MQASNEQKQERTEKMIVVKDLAWECWRQPIRLPNANKQQ